MAEKTELTYYKTFNGKRYYLFGYGSSKANTNKIVRGYKTLGFKTRVVSFTGYSMFDDMKEHKQKQYAVYVSVKKEVKK